MDEAFIEKYSTKLHEKYVIMECADYGLGASVMLIMMAMIKLISVR